MAFQFDRKSLPNSALAGGAAIAAFAVALLAPQTLHDGDMSFLHSNHDILAFTREKAGEKLLFVFNLTREKAEFVPAKSLKLGEPLPVPGFGAKLKDGTIELDALDMACVRL